MNAAEARARATKYKDAAKNQAEIQRAHAYRKYRDSIDKEITERAAAGFFTAIPNRPIDLETADVLAMRLRRKGYHVRWMTHGPLFEIRWGDQ